MRRVPYEEGSLTQVCVCVCEEGSLTLTLPLSLTLIPLILTLTLIDLKTLMTWHALQVLKGKMAWLGHLREDDGENEAFQLSS